METNITDGLGRLRVLRQAIEASHQASAQLRTERDELVRQLMADGATLQQVADVLGVTRQRVHTMSRP